MNRKIYIDNLQDEQKQRYSSENIEVLTPQEIFDEKLEDTDALVVLCELNVDKDGNNLNRSDFYGVKLVQELRRNKFMGKVLFVSFVERKDIVKEKPFNSIINTVGHSFLRLPHQPLEWSRQLIKVNVLDKVEWYDIVSNYCAKEGLAQQELHQLRGLLNDKSFKNKFIEEQVLFCINQIGLLYDEDTTDFRLNLDFDDIQQAIEKTDNYCNKIIRRNNPEENSFSEFSKKKPWSILFLDDEIDKTHNLITELEKKVEQVYCVKNVKDAEKILKRNVNEGLKISLIVSDYRLFDTIDTIKIHQEKQGYKFLMDTSSKYPYLGLVAFSSLSRRFLLQSFKRMGIRVDVYSKKDYLVSDTTLKILIDELIDKGNEASDAIIRLPRLSSPHWKNFEPFYTYHRKSVDYLANEQYISNKAKTYCVNYKEGNVFFNLTDYTTELKGKSKTPDKPKFFKEFLEKMICRRAILWYSRKDPSNPINSPKDIIKFLQGVNYNSEMSDNTPTNQINTNLALRLTEYPWNTTIEEKEWLINQMGTDRKKIEDVENKENEILIFAEKEIVKLETNPNCQPNTFVNCKMWLSEAASTQNISNKKDIAKTVIKIKNKLLKTINSVETEPPLIQILQDKKIVKDVQCKTILHQYKSLIDFFYYLTRLKKYIENYNNLLITGDKGANVESIRDRIILKAKKEFLSKGTNDKSNEYDLIASIYEFFGELNNKGEYPKTEAAYYSSFKVFYKEYKYSFSDPYRTVSLDLVSFALKDDDFNEEDYSS